MKYGLHDKALDHLKKVLAIDPGSADAHEGAGDVHAAAGRPDEAARAGALAVRALLAGGLADRARDAIARLRQIAPCTELREKPRNAAVAGTEEVQLGDGDIEEELVLSPDEPEDDTLALAAAGAQDDEHVEDELGGGAVDDEDDHVLAAARASAESDEVIDEGPSVPAPAPEPARAAPPRGAAARRVERPAPPPEPEEEEEQIDLSDEIDEADFFVQQGLLDEAREALENLLAFYPGHPAAQAKLAEVKRKAQPVRAAAKGNAPAAPFPEGPDASFDIARELADELGPSSGAPAEEEFQYSVEEVFNQFKNFV